MGVNSPHARLCQPAPQTKQNELGVILEAEAELLRAVADTLDCPIPPLGVEA